MYQCNEPYQVPAVAVSRYKYPPLKRLTPRRWRLTLLDVSRRLVAVASQNLTTTPLSSHYAALSRYGLGNSLSFLFGCCGASSRRAAHRPVAAAHRHWERRERRAFRAVRVSCSAVYDFQVLSVHDIWRVESPSQPPTRQRLYTLIQRRHSSSRSPLSLKTRTRMLSPRMYTPTKPF